MEAPAPKLGRELLGLARPQVEQIAVHACVGEIAYDRVEPTRADVVEPEAEGPVEHQAVDTGGTQSETMPAEGAGPHA